VRKISFLNIISDYKTLKWKHGMIYTRHCLDNQAEESMKRILVLSALLAMSAPAFAERDSGGGNAVVCFDRADIVSQMRIERQHGGGYIKNSDISHISSVELLDLHKAKLPTLTADGDILVPTIIESKVGETQKDYDKRIQTRLGLVPGILTALNNGKENIEYIKGVPNGLAPIDDISSGEVINTDNCVRSTIIAQYDEAGKTHILFDSRIYSLPLNIFSASSRAMSFWHEYFYVLARKAGATTSDTTQTLVGTLVKEGVTIDEALKAVKDVVQLSEYGDFYTRFMTEFKADVATQKLTLELTTYQKDRCVLYMCSPSDAREKELETSLVNQMNQAANYAKISEYYLKVWRSKLYSIPTLGTVTADRMDQAIQSWIKTSFTTYAYCRVLPDSDPENPFKERVFECQSSASLTNFPDLGGLNILKMPLLNGNDL
jgi:hypothetical protein